MGGAWPRPASRSVPDLTFSSRRFSNQVQKLTNRDRLRRSLPQFIYRHIICGRRVPAAIQQPLRSNSFKRYLLNIRTVAGMFKSDRANVSVWIQVQYRVFIKVFRFSNVLITEFNIQRIGILKVLHFHGLNPRSKNALCTVTPSAKRITLRYRPPISFTFAQRRIRPSSCTVSVSGN